MNSSFCVTVTQLNRYVKSLLDGDEKVKSLFVQGEISNFTRQQRSGHLYFTLKDEESVIRCVMFQSHASRLRFQPTDNMRVILRADLTVYERGGNYQLMTYDIQPDGVGALHLAFEQLKERLSKEGLFAVEHKRPVTRFPGRIAIVTSKTGAAVHDMLSILERRWPVCQVVLCPVLVQGDAAAADITRAVSALGRRDDLDVIIIGRGGGSIEDLWAFNDETLARTIFHAKVPVISAVGHETDYTIADFVADLRAPTPSAAAELISPGVPETMALLRSHRRGMGQAMERIFSERGFRLERIAGSPTLKSPAGMVTLRGDRLVSLTQRFQTASARRIETAAMDIAGKASMLDAMSPLKVLTRGYALVRSGDRIIRRAADLAVGEEVSVSLMEGCVRAKVLSITETEGNGNAEKS